MVLEAQENKNIVTIFGASDDLIEISGINGASEFNSYAHPSDGYSGVIHLTCQSTFEQMFVFCYYGKNGCWHFAPAIVDEGKPLPSWRMEYSYDPNIANAYSVILNIEVPADTYMKFFKRI